MKEKELNRLRKKAWKNRNRWFFPFQLPLGPSPFDDLALLPGKQYALFHYSPFHEFLLKDVNQWYDDVFKEVKT